MLAVSAYLAACAESVSTTRSSLNEAHVLRVLREYVAYHNTDWPRQGLQQCIPDPPAVSGPATGTECATPVLGGLHDAYARAA